MVINGYKVKLNDLLTYRYSNGDELDLNGEIIPKGHCVFINIKNCNVISDGGRTYYDVDNAPMIPTINLNNYCAMGQYKMRNSFSGITIDGNVIYQYYQAPIYFQRDGRVYVGSVRMAYQ